MPRHFCLETLVDFPDDALNYEFPITPEHIDALMATLAGRGVGRVIWGYYGDGHGGFLMPSGIDAMVRELGMVPEMNYYGNYARTLEVLGNPLAVAVEAGRRHGVEVYAYFKPYETGPAMDFAEGSPEARQWGRIYRLGGYLSWLDPFVVKHPDLRIQRRTDDLWPGHETATIATIRLTKKDDAPTRIAKERLQIWTRDLNFGYRRKAVDLRFEETVEPAPRELRDVYGNVLTRQGQPVRVLTLSGLSLDDRYVLVTTDFTDGPGDFENAWDRLLTCRDAQGREIPGVFATGTAIWFPELEDFRERGVLFDTGRGPEAITLDTPNGGDGLGEGQASNRHYLPGQKKVRGCIAFTRGRNTHLPGALCETEPAVQAYWLDCLREILDAGVHGVEFRVENHSCHTDTPEDYGFNPAVMQRVRPGAAGAELLSELTRVRGEAYTDFLRRAKALIASRGKRMRVNLNLDWFRPPHERPGSRKLAYPANIDFHWRRWLDEGLLDEAMLRPFAKPFAGIFGEDPVAQEMIAACRKRGIPIAANRYVWGNPELLDEFTRTLGDGRLSGLVLYETWSYTRIEPDGRWLMARTGQPPTPGTPPAVWEQRALAGDRIHELTELWKAQSSR